MNNVAVNTQNKIYNEVRSTYLDDSDLKEGEVFCKKCKGIGSMYTHPFTHACTKCSGKGIVDWVAQAVERPVVIPTDSSAGISISQSSKPSNNMRNVLSKRVTNYKRRNIV